MMSLASIAASQPCESQNATRAVIAHREKGHKDVKHNRGRAVRAGSAVRVTARPIDRRVMRSPWDVKLSAGEGNRSDRTAKEASVKRQPTGNEDSPVLEPRGGVPLPAHVHSSGQLKSAFRRIVDLDEIGRASCR